MFKRPHDAEMVGGAVEEKSALHEHTKISDSFLLTGLNISHLPRKTQFLVCALGVLVFSLVYGFLQELISVHLCNRRLGLFLTMVQFAAHTLWSFVLRIHVYGKQIPRPLPKLPFCMYLRLSCLRAVDLGMTNMAMQYVSYPTLTLMKSSRVVVTMLFGVLITRKRYKLLDYVVVILMITGLAIFINADAVFSHIGIVMLVSFPCAV
jgi:drug/metabolite transporter (DMT)-like permease